MPLGIRHIIYGENGERIGYIRVECPSQIAYVLEFKTDRKLTRTELKKLHEKLKKPHSFNLMVKGYPKAIIVFDPDDPFNKRLDPPYRNSPLASIEAYFDKEGKLKPIKKNKDGFPIDPRYNPEDNR